jgi:hypothetical protein
VSQFGEGLVRAHGRAGIRWPLVAVALGIALVGGGLAVIALTHREPVKEQPGGETSHAGGGATMPTERQKEQGVADVGAAGDVEGCDHEAVRRIMKRLRDDGEHARALGRAAAYEERCPVNTLMRWMVYDSSKELGRYDEALKIAAALRANEPSDHDYWEWHADMAWKLDLDLEAANDHRHMFALARVERPDGEHGAGIDGAINFAQLASAIGRPCDGAFALRFLLMQKEVRFGGELQDGTLEELAALAAEGGCQAQVGRGSGELPLKGARIPVSIAGVMAMAIVDPKVPYVTITDAVAARAGVATDAGRALPVAIGEDLHDARVVELEVRAGELAVDRLDVAVVPAKDGLPEVILGHAFLWRWDVVFAGPALVLTPIEDATVPGEIVDYTDVY